MSTDRPNSDPRSQRLGRGLEALLGAVAPVAPAAPATGAADAGVSHQAHAAGPTQLRTTDIRPNPSQPRREFSERELDELSTSLAAHGMLQPVLVRKAASGYELVAGERRWRAATRLGWETLPAIVRDVDDSALLTLALVENLQRSDLNPIEEAEGYQRLVDEFGLSHQQIADAVGKDRSTVANTLRLLQLPSPVRAMLTGGQLTMGHARAILAVPDDQSRVELARQAVARGYTVRDLERLAKSSAPKATSGAEKGPASQRDAGASAHSATLRQLTDSLRRHLQTDVRVESADGKSGEIHVRFYSPDDLERILDRMLGAARHVL